MSRRTDRDPRAGSALLSLLLWLALVSAASGTGRLLEGVGWLVQLALAVGVVLAVPAGARALRAHPVVPPVLGTLTAVVVLTAMFVPARALFFLLPTPAAIADAQTLAQAGFTSIAQQGLPATADSGIAFLLVGGVVVLAWAADLFAFSVRLPALTGLFLLALLAVPAIIDPSEVSWPSLVLTALAYAGVLAAGSRPERRAPARRLSAASALPSVAVVGVVVVSAGLLAGSASGYVRTPSSSGVSGTLFNGSIDPVVALGDDLRRPNPVTVLRYSTDSDLPVYLRVLTVSDFDGENWAPSGTEATAPVEEPIAPEGLAESVPRETEQVEVEVETLRSQWLPVPYPISSLEGVGDGWLQDVQDGSIRGDATTRAGDEYRVEALRLAPDPQQLLAAPASGDALERYLALPADVPDVVGTTAAEVTAEAGNAYDRARALQSFFRSSEFTYSEDTPAEEGYDGDGVGVLEAFLEVREGYCVHFASAMAVMARELGIPSRLAIGYQPGSVVPSSGSDLTDYRLLSSDLHAWPELFFEGVGWLPFEPTPSRGAPASYTLPSATSSTGATPGASAGAAPEQSEEAEATPTPTASSATATPGAVGSSTAATAPVVTAWVLLLLLLLVPWLLRLVQRSIRRRAAATGSAEAAWAEVLASARDLGVPVEETDSPRAQEALLRDALGEDAAARNDLSLLRDTVERARYAPVPASETAGWAAGARVVRALRIAAGAPRRAFAAVLPRSALGAFSRVGRPSSDL